MSRTAPSPALGGLDPGVEPEAENVVLGGASERMTRGREGHDGAIQRDDPTPTAAAAAVTAATKTNAGPTWKDNGAFDWRVGFATSGVDGWLVQKIDNKYEGTDAAGQAFTKALPTPTYWEAWAVGSDGAVSPAVGPNNDYWIRPNRGTGSKGSWSMKAEVHFSTTDPATQGFTPGGAKDSGILLSSTSAPDGLGPVLFKRSADGTWDSKDEAPKAHKGAAS